MTRIYIYLVDIQVRHFNQLMQGVRTPHDRHAKLDCVACSFKGHCVIFLSDLPE
jgi:hypothetical protein